MRPTALFTVLVLICAIGLATLAMGAHTVPEPRPVPWMSPEEVPPVTNVFAEVLVEDLEHPWALAFLPGGDMLVTERPGRLRIIRDGQLDPTPVPGLPPLYTRGQGGLLDLVPHPDFATNRYVYFTYAHGDNEANHTRLSRAVFDGERLTGLTLLFEVSQKKPKGQHFGSRLAWMPDGSLLMSIGDGGNPPTKLDGEYIRNQAQSRASHLGKVLRLTEDGHPAPDNPFAGDADAAPEVFSYGHRNIQGLAWDPLRKKVWVSEHGAFGGDELNAPVAGGNFGWPAATFSREYLFRQRISDHESLPGMVDPVVVWTPAIAPSGLTLYTGDAFPKWRGDLLVGGLKDKGIRIVELDEEGRVVGQSRLDMDERVRDVRQGPDGLIYVLTDEDDGRLIRLSPR